MAARRKEKNKATNDPELPALSPSAPSASFGGATCTAPATATAVDPTTHSSSFLTVSLSANNNNNNNNKLIRLGPLLVVVVTTMVLAVVVSSHGRNHGRGYTIHSFSSTPKDRSATTQRPITSSISGHVTAAAAHTTTNNNNHNHNMTTELPPLLARWGWMNTVEYFRFQVANASRTMYHEHQEHQEQKERENDDTITTANVTDYERYTTDISPFYHVVWEAVDTIGVKGLLFDVFFEGLSYYGLKDDKDCMGSSGHGFMCAHYGFWWFYHHTGAVLAEKLFKEGRLLWDPTATETEETYVTDFLDLQERIHIRQTLPYAWEMSIHVQHGLLWHYTSVVDPNMTEFPTQMVYDWCGKWVFEEHKMKAIGKRVGFACVHGFGHMVFYLAARHQLDPNNDHPPDARRQIRAMSGFELNHDSICRIQQICVKAEEMTAGWKAHGEEYATDAANRCKGGAVHSMRLMMAKGDPITHKERRKTMQDHFYEQHAICEREAAAAAAAASAPSAATVSKEHKDSN